MRGSFRKSIVWANAMICVLWMSTAMPAGALEQPVSLTLATMSVGSAMYTNASALANLWTTMLPDGSRIDVTTTSPGGVGAPVILEMGDCDLIFGNAAPAKWACDSGILEMPPTTRVRSMAGGLDSSFINILFTQSFVDRTGITSVEEIIEKKHPVRIAIKANGAFGELACAKVLSVLGVDYATIKSWGGSVTQTGADAIVSLLKDDRADMTIDHIGAGQSATTELCMTADMFFPELKEETRKNLNGEGFANTVIPANTWSGQTGELQSVGSPQVVLCSADLDEDLVYALTKAMCEGRDDLIVVNAGMRYFNPSTAHEALNVGAPLHPGAEKYYREAGYLK